MTEKLIKTGTYVDGGENYLANFCYYHTNIELKPHGKCKSGVRGILVTPIEVHKTENKIAYTCSHCHQKVFQHAEGVCT